MPTNIQQFALANSVCSLAWQILQLAKKIPTAQADGMRFAMIGRVNGLSPSG